MKALLFLLFALALAAQTVKAPNASVLVSDTGRLVAVRGAFSNLLPARVLTVDLKDDSRVISAAFAGDAAVLKTDRHLLIADASGTVQARFNAPEGAAQVAFENGHARAVYYPASGQLMDLNGGAAVAINAISLALGPVQNGELQTVSFDAGQLWLQTLSLTNGSVTSQFPLDGAPPAAAFEGGWLTSKDGGLLWTPSDGSAPRSIALAESPVSLTLAGEHAICINGRWLLTPAWQPLRIPAAVLAPVPVRRSWR
jgi:hypothetical protein